MKKYILIITPLISLGVYAQTGNVGVSTNAPGSTLTVNGSFAATYKKVTANYTMTTNDYYLAAENATAVTITLPIVTTANPSIQGRDYNIKNTGAGTVTIQAGGTERLDNQSGNSITSITLATGEYARIIATGNTTVSTTTAQWEVAVVGNGQYIEPWNNQTTLTPATNNTQNIYQLGKVAIGTTSAGASQLLVQAAPSTDGIRLASTLTPNSYIQQSIIGDGNFLTFGVRDQTSILAQTFIGSNTTTDFALRTDALDRVTIKTGTGNVGINTTSPTVKLQVNGNIGAADNSNIASATQSTVISNGFIDLHRDATYGYNGGLDFKDSFNDDFDNRISFIKSQGGASGSLKFFTSTDGTVATQAQAMMIDNATANVGIGSLGVGATIAPSSDLHVFGTMAVATATSGTAASVVLQNAGTFTPPTASASPGRIYIIRNTSTTTAMNVANIINFGANTAATFSLSATAGAITIVSNGSNWYRIQ